MKKFFPILLLLAASPSFAQRTTSHDINGTRYANFGPGSPFNWSQLPSSPASLSASVQATVTLTPCPLGVDTSNTTTRPYYVYVSTVGTPEAALVTGGTCTPALASGTIIFTPLNSHSAGYSVGTASTGAQEALNDAQIGVTGTSYRGNFKLVFQPTQPANTAYFACYARVTINTGPGDIDGAGASLDSEAADTCFYFGVNATSVHVHGFRVASKVVMAGAAITNTDCGITLDKAATITSTLNPPVNSWVDIANTDNPRYWNLHQVTATSGSSFKYADTSCTGGGTVASLATPGNVALLHTAFRDNGTQVTFSDITLDTPAWSTANALNHVIVVENDQSFNADHINANGTGVRCDANYCGDIIYNPGTFATNAAVGHVRDSQLSMQCAGNGITWRGGNTLDIQDTIIQGFNQYGIQSSTLQGGFGTTIANNVYMEVGACSNPFYTQAGLSGLAAQSMGGVNLIGKPLVTNAAIGASGSAVGQEPQFSAGGGATTYEYWLVICDGARVVGNCSMPLRFGQAAPPNGNAFTVAWPRYGSGTGNAVTYDILKTIGAGNALIAPLPDGVNHSVALATNIAQCAGLVCTFSDTQPALSAYSAYTNPGLLPPLPLWPGSIVLGLGALLYTTDLPITNLSGIVTTLQNEPSVFAQRCGIGSPGVWVICPHGNSSGNGVGAVGAYLPQNGPRNGGQTVNLKGLINPLVPPSSSLNPGCVYGIVDSTPWATLADAIHRPVMTATDNCIGLDNGNVSLPLSQMAFTSPVAISNYIGSLFDGTSWKERLTASLKEFNVATKFDLTTSFLGSAAFKRFTCDNATTLINGDFVLTGWGSTAAVTFPVTKSTDCAAVILVTASGTGQTANPTIQFTFHDGTWTNVPICLINQTGGNDIFSDVMVNSRSATVYTWSYLAIPAASKTYEFTFHCVGS